jgi:hypothetical protein
LTLQINTGQCYFTEPTEDRCLYRGKDKDRHLRYRPGPTLRVLIVLCDPDTKTLYWRHVTPERVNEADSASRRPSAKLLAPLSPALLSAY